MPNIFDYRCEFIKRSNSRYSQKAEINLRKIDVEKSKKLLLISFANPKRKEMNKMTNLLLIAILFAVQ